MMPRTNAIDQYAKNGSMTPENIEYINRGKGYYYNPNALKHLGQGGYTYVITTIPRKEEPTHIDRRRELSFMKRSIPISFALWGAISLLFATLFTTMFFYGWITHIFLFGVWLNLFLSVASIGMTVTVIVGIVV